MSVPIIQLRDLTPYMYEHLDVLLELANAGIESFRPKSPAWKRYVRSIPVGHGRGAAAQNVRNGLHNLGIINADGLTPFGRVLYARRRNQQFLKQEIAKEALLNRGGWAFCHALDVCAGGGREAIWEFYREQYHPEMPEHRMNISHFNHLLVWLEVSDEQYRFNRGQFQRLCGLSTDAINELLRLSEDARRSCLGLLGLGPGWHPGRDIRHAVDRQTGKSISVHSMHAIARELQRAGLIDYRQKGQGALERGQHGEWRVRRTRETRVLTDSFLSKLFQVSVNWDLADALHKPFPRLLQEMKSENRDRKGRALEQFVAKICWKMGIRSLRFRSRDVIRGIEVDLVGEKLSPTFHRYLVQCKNHKNPIGPSAISKELGVSVIRSIENLIVASTAGFVEETRPYIREVIQKTGRNIFLLDERDISKLCQDENSLFEIVERENHYNRSIRTGEDTFWLEIELGHFLPPRIRQYRWGPQDYAQAWLRLVDDQLLRTETSRESFERVYVKVYDSLQS